MAIETLGEALKAGWRIQARCGQDKSGDMEQMPECRSRFVLDMETLIWTRGERFPLDLLESCLVCPKCLSRRVAIWFDHRPVENVRSDAQINPIQDT
jgi:hypothetical protein